MKRLIPASILLAFIIAVSVFGKLTVDSSFKKINVVLEECKESIENKDIKKAEKEANEIKNIWNSSKNLISLFANRRLTDELEKSIGYLNVYIKDNNLKQAAYEYETINRTIDKLISDQTLSIESFC